MKKVLLLILIVLVLLSVPVIMFLLHLCPPSGPWPTPPWCLLPARQTYNVEVSPQALSVIKAVNMYDTWGRNYHMSMFENTRDNIDASFDRVKELGASEVYVHDFHRAIFDKGADFTTTRYHFDDETFWNDFRDESLNAKDLKKLSLAAHARGLKLGIKHNLHFVDLGKYIAKGVSGDISSAVSADYEAFNASHSEEWIKDFFTKWQERLVNKARLYQENGVDIMSVSPSFMDPRFSGHEDLANGLWRDLIATVRQNFSGQIMVDYNVYGLVDGRNGEEDWTRYDYYRAADIVETKVYKILEKFQTANPSNEEVLRQDINKMVNALDQRAAGLGLKLSLFFAPSSYQGGLYAGPVEFLDINNERIRGLQPDYSSQAKAFDFFLSALSNQQHIVRINVANFDWDDALDPGVRARVSLSASFRNKPAEAVIKAWFNQP